VHAKIKLKNVKMMIITAYLVLLKQNLCWACAAGIQNFVEEFNDTFGPDVQNRKFLKIATCPDSS
jgi:hypothetical protein